MNYLDPENLSSRLKTARRLLKLTQADLATRSGLPQTQISRFEHQTVTDPSYNQIVALAQAFGLTPEVLAGPDTDLFLKQLCDVPEAQPQEGFNALTEWTHNENLTREINYWIEEGLTILVEDSGVLDRMMTLPSVEIATVTNENDIVAPGSLLTTPLASDCPIVSHPFQPQLISTTHAYIGTATTEDLGWLQNDWRSLCAHGLIFLRGSDHFVCAEQYLVTVDDKLVTLPLWESTDSGVVRLSSRVGHKIAQEENGNLLLINDALNPPPGLIAFGETERGEIIAMPVAGLKTHMYLCGSTGTGKTSILNWMLYGLAKNNQSFFYIDPHGSSADYAAAMICQYAPERADDVVILDWGDLDHPIGFNPLDVSEIGDIERVVMSVKETILKMLGLSADSAPRAVNYVEQAVWAMTECNVRALRDSDTKLTLLHIPDFFTDREFRQAIIQFCTNISVRSTFNPDGPFEKLGERQQLDHVMPVLRTFAALGIKDSFGNVFGQNHDNIDFAKWVEDNKLVFLKLPAIASDSAVSKFIGAMITPMLISSLSDWGPNPALSSFLVIDEFQNYATESYSQLLAQTRKHGLSAISSNQVPQDLPADVLRGVQSNTQTKISMCLDPFAAKEVAAFIASGQEHPTTNDVMSLPNYWGWGNYKLANGTSTGPFKFKGIVPPEVDFGPAYTAAIERSRQLYSKPREGVWNARQNQQAAIMIHLNKQLATKVSS